MLVRVNKKGSSTKPVKYAALSTALNAATSSGVWLDEETSNLAAGKRRNRIRMTRDASRSSEAQYDA